MSAWKMIKSVGNAITVGFGLYILMKGFYDAGKEAGIKSIEKDSNPDFKKSYDDFYKNIMG